MNENGIRVTGGSLSRHRLPSETGPTAPESNILLTHYSAPLSDQIEIVLANSQNLYAEVIGRNAALDQGYPADFRGTTEYITDVMEREGIIRPGFVIFDASGLSPLNRIPARALLELMRHVNDLGLEGDIFKEALARPGERGSLRARLSNLEGRLRAKTGTLGDTNAIAGYLRASDGREYKVVLMVDLTSRRGGQAALDEMMLAIAENIDAKARDRELRTLFP